jgi:hypothetical protein
VLPTSGIAVTSGCGSKVLKCSAAISLFQGATGSTVVTLAATDPYGQMATGTASINVNPVPKNGGGGALDAITLLALGSVVLRRFLPGALKLITAAR